MDESQKNTMPSERSQPQKATYCMISFTAHHPGKDNIIRTENRSLVATGYRELTANGHKVTL